MSRKAKKRPVDVYVNIELDGNSKNCVIILGSEAILSFFFLYLQCDCENITILWRHFSWINRYLSINLYFLISIYPLFYLSVCLKCRHTIVMFSQSHCTARIVASFIKNIVYNAKLVWNRQKGCHDRVEFSRRGKMYLSRYYASYLSTLCPPPPPRGRLAAAAGCCESNISVFA